MDWTALDAHGALLVVGLARDRIEGALRDLIRVALGKMKGKEDLAGSNDFRDSQLNFAHATARGDNFDAIVRAQIELSGVDRIHLKPGPRRHSLQNRDAACLGARVPMLHGAASVEDQRELDVGLLREWRPGSDPELGSAVPGGEVSIRIEPPRGRGSGHATLPETAIEYRRSFQSIHKSCRRSRTSAQN